MAKKTATDRLDAARAAIEVATKQIADIEAQRNGALLADNDDLAVKLLAKLETLRAVARGHADKIGLLQGEVQREQAAATVRSHQAQIGQFAKMLDASDTDLIDGADLIGQGWKKILAGIEKRERALPAFAVHSAHARGSGTNIDGAAMSAEAIVHLLSFEFYRISARPLLGGRPGERTRPALPGAKPVRIEHALMPEKIEPFASKVRAASAFAVQLLTEEIGKGGDVDVPAPAPPNETDPPWTRTAAEIQRDMQREADARDRALSSNTFAPSNGKAPRNDTEPRERSAAEVELAKLLNKQSELSTDISPEGETAYQAVCLEVARVSQQVENERMEKAS